MNEAAQLLAEAVAFETAYWPEHDVHLNKAWVKTDFVKKGIGPDKLITDVSIDNDSGKVNLVFNEHPVDENNEGFCHVHISMRPEYTNDDGGFNYYTDRSQSTAVAGVAVQSSKGILNFICKITLAHGMISNPFVFKGRGVTYDFIARSSIKSGEIEGVALANVLKRYCNPNRVVGV